MSLQFDAQLAARNFDVSLQLPEAETLALLGLNGAGKSTVLQLLSGLLTPDSGHAQLNGRALFGLSPHERRIALMAQEPLLFPHMSAVNNVAFGPRSRGLPKADATQAALRWLDEVDAAEFADRKPAELSGGQAQRVALARALAAEPELLLLDEPLAALDVDIAVAVRQPLRRVLRGRTAILVTPEILDAVLLADRIAVLDDGRVVEEGPTQDVMRQPRSAFAASLCGLNMVTGLALDEYALRSDTTVIHGEPEPPLTAGQQAIAVFRPSAVSVHRAEPSGSPRNVVRGALTALEPQAHLVRVRMAELSADITPASVAELDLTVGSDVWFAVKAAEVALYPA